MSQRTEDYYSICDCINSWKSHDGHEQLDTVADDFFFAQAPSSTKNDALPQYVLQVPANWSLRVKGETHANYRQVVTCFDESKGQLSKFTGQGEGGVMRRQLDGGGSAEDWNVSPSGLLRSFVFQFGYYDGYSSNIQVPKIARTNIIANPTKESITSIEVVVYTEDWNDGDNNDTILRLTFQPAN